MSEIKNFPRKGLVQVYTGTGKGKTTASLGLALRACGHGLKTFMVCFMKGDPNYGEVIIADKIPNFKLVQSGLPTFVKKGEPSKEDLKLARQGIKPIGVIHEDSSIAMSWLRGTSLDATKTKQDTENIIEELETVEKLYSVQGEV